MVSDGVIEPAPSGADCVGGCVERGGEAPAVPGTGSAELLFQPAVVRFSLGERLRRGVAGLPGGRGGVECLGDGAAGSRLPVLAVLEVLALAVDSELLVEVCDRLRSEGRPPRRLRWADACADAAAGGCWAARR